MRNLIQIVESSNKSLNEDIEWPGKTGELFHSLRGLITNNNGLYKSPKQKSFLINQFGGDNSDNAAFCNLLKNTYGIVFPEEPTDINVAVTLGKEFNGNMKPRIYHPRGWLFVLDEKGVRVQYALKWKDNDRVDPSATTVVWTRSISPEQEQSNGFFGELGKKYNNILLTIESILGPHTNEDGSFYSNRLRDKQKRLFLYLGKKLGRDGSIVRLNFNVEKHGKSKISKEPITVINSVELL